jgi:SNF2 family DNA or RNA helicase
VFTDVRTLPPEDRYQRALRAHDAYDVDLPRLAYWNYDPCSRHQELTPGCAHCGVNLRRHQRIGAAWLYLAGRGLLADSVGLGKSAQVLALLAMMCETGEINDGRVVIVCRAAAVGQWRDEINRMVPSLLVITADGTPAKRRAKYMEPWHVAVISPNTLAGGKGTKRSRPGDIEILRQFPMQVVVYDDTDAMRNPTNRQAWAIKKLCSDSRRAYGVHGTPLQKRLTELWSFLEPLGGPQVLGSQLQFKHRFVKQGATYFYQQAMVCEDDHLSPMPHRKCQWRPEGAPRVCGKPCWPDTQHRKVVRTIAKEIGILPGMVEDFKQRIHPLVLRRTAADVDDVSLPAIQPSHVWLEPTAAQRTRYDEVRQGVLRQLKEEGEEVTHAVALARFTRARQVCSGLASLDGRDSASASAKLDWVVDKLEGDLAAEKVVVFVQFTPNVTALSQRLTKAGIGHEVIMGDTPKPVRDRARIRFRDDPDCHVLIGTTSIEQSLNLQCARHMICVDVIINPARMEQLAGRVRRIGSAYETVYVHFLFLSGTLEEGFLALLEQEQALADTVWDETSQLFDTLSARQMLELVAYHTTSAMAA